MLNDLQQFPYSRLVYLVVKHKILIPKTVVKWIPGGDWLRELAIAPSSFANDNSDQVLRLYQTGEKLGSGDRAEAAALLGEYIDILLEPADLGWEQRKKIYDAIAAIGSGETTLAPVQVDLGEPGEGAQIPKFNTGFTPLDAVTGGIYQGIFTFMAPPGAGKTSLLLTLGEELRKNNVCNSLLIVQTEIPGPLIKARMQPIFSRTQFKPGIDTLFAASWDTGDILRWTYENPDEDRIIIYDSPDTVVMGGGDGTRHMIAKSFKDLIELKQLCKAIFVSTWPRRGAGSMNLESGSEGASKERFSDAMIAITSFGGRVRLRVLKNRFGEPGRSITFGYDFANMDWDRGDIDLEDDW